MRGIDPTELNPALQPPAGLCLVQYRSCKGGRFKTKWLTDRVPKHANADRFCEWNLLPVHIVPRKRGNPHQGLIFRHLLYPQYQTAYTFMEKHEALPPGMRSHLACLLASYGVLLRFCGPEEQKKQCLLQLERALVHACGHRTGLPAGEILEARLFAAGRSARLRGQGGGRAIAARGGGIALGTTILGVTTLGAGILVGGIIFNFAGSKLSEKADKAKEQMEKAEREINQIRIYLVELAQAAAQFEAVLSDTNRVYRRHLERLDDLVILSDKTDWNLFTDAEKTLTENTVLLVSLLYQMCKVQLVLQSQKEGGLNQVNHTEIEKASDNATNFLEEKGLLALA